MHSSRALGAGKRSQGTQTHLNWAEFGFCGSPQPQKLLSIVARVRDALGLSLRLHRGGGLDGQMERHKLQV